jgi:sec-independent protein translocase protein TatA
MFGGAIGWQEITIVLVIVLLLFGAKRIPDVMRSFGKGIKEFKKGMRSIQDEIEKEDEPEEKPKPNTKDDSSEK